MSLKNVTTPEKNVRVIEFTADKETFDKAIDKVYKNDVKKINIPGFRKGKAPKSVIEKFYGKGVFYEEALNEILPAAYSEALKEANLEIVSQPEFDVKTIDDNGVEMTAKVYVKPEVSVSDYKGLTATKETKAVTDADIDAEIAKVRERNARILDVTDRAAAMGDTVVLDFDGTVDGKSFDGGKAEKYQLKLGSNQFIPGFEEQVVGKNIGDEFDVCVTFPADYHVENLKGKAAVFACKLHEIKMTELPALDDEFAKDVSEFDSLAAYRADLQAKMEKNNEKVAQNAVEEQLISALIEKLDADIPQAMFDTEVENQVRDFDNRLRQQGMDLKTYFKYTGLNLDSMREQFKPMAERQVKTRLALEKIVELEGITASDEEIEKDYADIAKAYGMELEQVKKVVESSSVGKDITVKKAVDLVKGAAVITEKAAEEEKEAKPEEIK